MPDPIRFHSPILADAYARAVERYATLPDTERLALLSETAAALDRLDPAQPPELLQPQANVVVASTCNTVLPAGASRSAVCPLQPPNDAGVRIANNWQENLSRWTEGEVDTVGTWAERAVSVYRAGHSDEMSRHEAAWPIVSEALELLADGSPLPMTETRREALLWSAARVATTLVLRGPEESSSGAVSVEEAERAIDQLWPHIPVEAQRWVAGRFLNAGRELDNYVGAWAEESHARGPSSLQPIPSAELFDGVHLSGPKVHVEVGAVVGTRVDILLENQEESPAPNPGAQPIRTAAPAGAIDATGSTAFYAALRVVDSATRFSGHDLQLGANGPLHINPMAFVANTSNAFFDGVERRINFGTLGQLDDSGEYASFHGTPKDWQQSVAGAWLETSREFDIAAHECGHAAVHVLKPGLYFGVALAINEGTADSLAWLSVLTDPDVIDRVLEENGGDLRQPGEITRFGESIGWIQNQYKDSDPTNDDDRFIRSHLNDTSIASLQAERDSTKITPRRFGTTCDPHLVGQIVSGTAYDLFATRYETALVRGLSPEQAVVRARDEVGTLLTRCLRFLPEYNISLRDYALAMVRQQGITGDPESVDQLTAILTERGLVDAGEPLATLTSPRPPTDFVLDPELRDGDAVRAAVEELESQLVAEALAKREAGEPASAIVLIRHNRYGPTVETMSASDLDLYSDHISEDGWRVVRLRYQETHETTAAIHNPDYEAEPLDQYFSLVFDPDGALTDLYLDKPDVQAF